MPTKTFYTALKKSLFKKGFNQKQVNNINLIYNTCIQHGVKDKKQIAYIYATIYHETAATMQPIAEYGSDKYLSKYDTGRLAKNLGNTAVADGDGQKYKGRGFSMITGLDNYKKFSRILGIDLVKNPDLALDALIAAKIIVLGMRDGYFTGKKLADYINSTTKNYYSARRIINGLDKATLIAGYAVEFERGLE